MKDETDQHGEAANDNVTPDLWDIHQLTMDMAYFYAETQPLMIHSLWVASGCPTGYAGPMDVAKKHVHPYSNTRRI